MGTILSKLPLRTILASVVGALALIVLSIALGEYREAHAASCLAQERHALLLAGFVLTLAIAAILFLIRLGVPLRLTRQRLDDLLERHFPGTPGTRPRPGNEYARIDAALGLLEERIEAHGRGIGRINASILRVLRQAVILANDDGVITLFSPGAESMLGYSADEIVGKQTPMLFHDPEEMRLRDKELSVEWDCPAISGFPALIARAKMSGQVDEREWTYVCKDGTRLTVLLSITVFDDDEGKNAYCGVATDITESSQAAAEMLRLANHDALTQLPNRRLFEDRMRMIFARARRDETRFALMMIDLDRFKPVNDQYGHSVGDLLLCAVADRMRQCLRESDTLARLGGDEFVLILPMIEKTVDAVEVADKIRQRLAQPFDLADNVTVGIDCSVGVAIYPEHGGDEALLQKSADDAMYIAKALGRGQVYVAGDTRPGELSDGTVPPHDDRDRELLIWRPFYQCGEAVIDQEHEELFAHGNMIIRMAAAPETPPEKISEALYQLIGAIAVHFRNEESILQQHGYPELTEHASKHRQLTERAQALYRQSVERNLPMNEVLSFVTREVVGQHILNDDRRFSGFLKNASPREPECASAVSPETSP